MPHQKYSMSRVTGYSSDGCSGSNGMNSCYSPLADCVKNNINECNDNNHNMTPILGPGGMEHTTTQHTHKNLPGVNTPTQHTTSSHTAIPHKLGPGGTHRTTSSHNTNSFVNQSKNNTSPHRFGQGGAGEPPTSPPLWGRGTNGPYHL